MKILILILIPILSFAQKIQPKIAVDVFDSNHLTFESPMTNESFNVYQGNFRTRIGADLSYKNATLYFDQHLYMQRLGIQFDPTEAYWFAGAKYRINKFEIKAEHLCIHPVNTYSNRWRAKYYGGYNMISVSYGY